MCHGRPWNGIMGNHTVISLVSECDWAVLERCAPGLTLCLFPMHQWCSAHLSPNRSQHTFGHCRDRRRQMCPDTLSRAPRVHFKCLQSKSTGFQTFAICTTPFKWEVMHKVMVLGGVRGHTVWFFFYLIHINSNCIVLVHLKCIQ